MIALAAIAWKAACGLLTQMKIWIGRMVNESSRLSGRNAMNAMLEMRMIGAASPIARDSARIVPVRMPGSAAGRTWCRIVSQRVAPSAKDDRDGVHR